MPVTGGFLLDSSDDLWLLWGDGIPVSVALADRGKGSLYLDLQAIPNTFLWVKTAAASPAAWVQITFAAQTSLGFAAFATAARLPAPLAVAGMSVSASPGSVPTLLPGMPLARDGKPGAMSTPFGMFPLELSSVPPFARTFLLMGG
jgi:hypothetical protein